VRNINSGTIVFFKRYSSVFFNVYLPFCFFISYIMKIINQFLKDLKLLEIGRIKKGKGGGGGGGVVSLVKREL